MSRDVIVAKNAGFCFGVARATAAVEKAMATAVAGERIFTLGRLIHNDIYNERLRRGGVEVIGEDDIEALAATASEKSPVSVFVRAHGMTAATEAKLESCAKANEHFRYVDCTCSYVKKIHKIAAEQSEISRRAAAGESDEGERMFLVLGSATHPEVVGFFSRFDGEKYVFASAAELEEALNSGKLQNVGKKTPILVAQTTYNLEEWKNTKKILEKFHICSFIFDTICSVTESRQTEAACLARECDAVIVIGGRESSNSAKLYSICKSICADSVWIESAEELQNKIPFTCQKVGIVAGASTPHDIIEEVTNKMNEQFENFEELLEASFQTSNSLNTGDTVTGTITAINAGELQLDLGAKVTGVIKLDQITDDPGAKLDEMFKIGDSVEAFVIRVSDVEGFATLSKKRVDADKNWQKIVDACENQETLEGKVVEVTKGGVVASVANNRVFIPARFTGVPRDGDLSTLVGQTVSLRVIEAKDKRSAKGSITLVLREERRAKEKEFWAGIEDGKVYTGVVKSMTSYGAFVDLGGVDGMVHTSELSWKRIKSPAEVVSIGQEITVYVKSFDVEKKRISLGYKTEEMNPWNIFVGQYNLGDVVSVKIVSLMPFGAFAEIIDGVDGLIHVSHIADHKIGKPADVLQIGQVVDAKIVDINMENQQVNLSIRALIEEARAAEEAMPAEETADEAVVEDAAEEVVETPVEE